MINKSTIRNSNLELYRIILMIFIIAHHYVVNSGLMEILVGQPITISSLFLILFGAWGKTGINCFVLITGYFMVNKNITVMKFFKLLLVIMFYKFVIYFIFCATGVTSLSIMGIIEVFLPITQVTSNFAGCYLLFYLLIPYINIVINNIDKKQFQILLMITLFIYTFLGSIPIIDVSMNYVTWFIVLYLIGAYLRLYPIVFLERHSGKLFVLSSSLSMVSVYVFSYIAINYKKGYPYWAVSDSNKILAVTTAITMFLFFKKIRIKNSVIINKVAASTFGVLLIHANSDVMRKWLWTDLLDNVGAYEKGYGVVHAIVSVISVYIICCIIDMVRIKFIEIPVMLKFEKHNKKHDD